VQQIEDGPKLGDWGSLDATRMFGVAANQTDRVTDKGDALCPHSFIQLRAYVTEFERWTIGHAVFAWHWQNSDSDVRPIDQPPQSDRLRGIALDRFVFHSHQLPFGLIGLRVS
jgi:hypothetical protein